MYSKWFLLFSNQVWLSLTSVIKNSSLISTEGINLGRVGMPLSVGELSAVLCGSLVFSSCSAISFSLDQFEGT